MDRVDTKTTPVHTHHIKNAGEHVKSAGEELGEATKVGASKVAGGAHKAANSDTAQSAKKTAEDTLESGKANLEAGKEKSKGFFSKLGANAVSLPRNVGNYVVSIPRLLTTAAPFAGNKGLLGSMLGAAVCFGTFTAAVYKDWTLEVGRGILAHDIVRVFGQSLAVLSALMLLIRLCRKPSTVGVVGSTSNAATTTTVLAETTTRETTAAALVEAKANTVTARAKFGEASKELFAAEDAEKKAIQADYRAEVAEEKAIANQKIAKAVAGKNEVINQQGTTIAEQSDQVDQAVGDKKVAQANASKLEAENTELAEKLAAKDKELGSLAEAKDTIEASLVKANAAVTDKTTMTAEQKATIDGLKQELAANLEETTVVVKAKGLLDVRKQTSNGTPAVSVDDEKNVEKSDEKKVA